jgi:hypothetical protein
MTVIIECYELGNKSERMYTFSQLSGVTATVVSHIRSNTGLIPLPATQELLIRREGIDGGVILIRIFDDSSFARLSDTRRESHCYARMSQSFSLTHTLTLPRSLTNTRTLFLPLFLYPAYTHIRALFHSHATPLVKLVGVII